MIVVAVGLAFAERQGARQVALRRVVIVAQQLFEPPPGIVGKFLGGSQRLAVFEDRLLLDLAVGAQPDIGELVRLAAARSP